MKNDIFSIYELHHSGDVVLHARAKNRRKRGRSRINNRVQPHEALGSMHRLP